MVSLKEFVRIFRRLSSDEVRSLQKVSSYINKKELEYLRRLIKIHRIKIIEKKLNLHYKTISYPEINSNLKSEKEFSQELNKTIFEKV